MTNLADLMTTHDMATRYNLKINTVNTWRVRTLRIVRDAIADAGHPADALGDVRRLTADAYTAAMTTHGLPALTLPENASPLPDAFVGAVPVWRRDAMDAWAETTGRYDRATGTAKLTGHKGRPIGIRETRPRRRPQSADR